MRTILLIIALSTSAWAQTNGDFTSGLAGWTVTGSVSAETYQAGPVASFNGTATADFPNDGLLSQTIPAVAGTTYNLTFDLGAAGSAAGEQVILVTAANLSERVAIPRAGGGELTWFHQKACQFTATSNQTTITFKDVSSVTNGIDMLLDNVVVTAMPAVFTLASCNLAWNPQPDCTFKVWHGSALLATVTTNAATVKLPDDRLSAVTVTAFDSNGLESIPSAPLVVQPVISWATSNYVGWDKIAVGFTEFDPVKRFYRISYPLTHTPTP